MYFNFIEIKKHLYKEDGFNIFLPLLCPIDNRWLTLWKKVSCEQKTTKIPNEKTNKK